MQEKEWHKIFVIFLANALSNPALDGTFTIRNDDHTSRRTFYISNNVSIWQVYGTNMFCKDFSLCIAIHHSISSIFQYIIARFIW